MANTGDAWVRERSVKEGRVALVGAGPGDPELLTLRALRCLQDADVVLYDRLISREIIDLIPPGVVRISVGKASGRHSVSQDQTNERLVRLARAGYRVVRLKGGDPLVFGRGGEEALHLRENGIEFEIVPGITAALACTAYAGIPLTHRGVSRGYRVVTGHLRENGELNLDWRALAEPECTLIVYMGLANLDELSSRLIEAGLRAGTPAAIVQDGTTRNQRTLLGTLATLPHLARLHGVLPPALIVIGETVALARELDWLKPEERAHDEAVAVRAAN